MDMVMVGWIVTGWFAVAVVVSLALGGILRQAHVGDDDLVAAASKRKVMRYMRVSGAKPVIARTKPNTPQVHETGKRAVRATG